MLNISFFIAAFTSIFWFIFSLRYIDISTLSNLNLNAAYQIMSFFLFPIAFIWGLFAIIKGAYTERRALFRLNGMLELLQKNTESTASLCTALLEAKLEIKNGFIIQNFDTLISDINETLSDIIKRSNSISSTQMEHLWARTAGGERWLIAKTFIETYNFQSGFTDHLMQKAKKDSLLRASILEFQNRYQGLLALLENHDKQKLFYNMVKYGALGKVYSLILPIAQNLLKKEVEPYAQTISHPTKSNFIPIEEPLSFPSFFNDKKEEKKPSAPKSPSIDIETGLNAIRQEILSAPTINPEPEIPPAPKISNFDNTKSALQNLKNTSSKNFAPSAPKTERTIISLDELEKEINASPENNYDEYAYPFGAWADDKKNK